MIDIFKNGDKQVLADVLANKEARENHKKALLNDKQNQTLISVFFNIPGDIKNNIYITKGFLKALTDFERYLVAKGLTISLDELFDKPTGPEAYFLIDSRESTEIKKICIEYEKIVKIGRLLDIDVYRWENNQLKFIDRALLKQEPRLCYICEQPAKECARNQTHDIAQLRTSINEMFAELL